MDWVASFDAAVAAFAERGRRLDRTGGSEERPDLRVSGRATAAWAAGLAALMAGRTEQSRDWLCRAADIYRESWELAPPGSWGRPVAALRCRIMAGDVSGAAADADWALEAGAAESASPIGRYAGVMALLVHARDAEAAELAQGLVADASLQPVAVAEALVAIAESDGSGYRAAAHAVLRSFEERDAFLEDVRVADTVLVLDRLAEARNLPRPVLASPLLP